MTDPAPNIKVVLSSDLFDDDPCLESMSVQATAVLNAYMTGYGWLDGPTKEDCLGVAAALRAAADQVVPEKLESYGIRYELLRIADELEAQ